MKIKRIISAVLAAALTVSMASAMSGCGESKKQTVNIITSAEDYRVEYIEKRLKEKFPDYDITIEYKSTGDHAALLMSEGKNTEFDITYDLEYSYMDKMVEKGYLADLSGLCDFSVFSDDIVTGKYYIPEVRNGGAVIVNTELLEEKNLEIPASYEDLLKPEYKSLISMPNPKSSGTGYMFLLSLVNSWGEDKAFEYFDKLTDNILAYTSSGSGPINALLQKEAAIGLGMTAQAVTKINESDAKFKILFFEEGSPYSMYGAGIISGKETNEAVKEVFSFLYSDVIPENNQLFYPERIFKNADNTIPNYPTDIVYSDMSNNTPEEKERLLEKWNH